MVKKFVPQRGDIVGLDVDPQTESEQAGRRPALVLSHRLYNKKVGLIVCCPITRHSKGYPFEVNLPENLPVTGVILSDQIKSLDWQQRRAKLICKTDPEFLDDVLAKFLTLIQ